MTVRQIWVAVLLTVTYLLAELAFNARLLDVVGAVVSVDELHNIELSGRLLSSIAAALFAWQLMLPAYNKLAPRAAGVAAIAVAAITVCVAFGTYRGIEAIVERAVAKTDADFRRTSVFLTLVQKSMVDGRVVVEGLSGGSEVFAKPEGKAFLGVFPLMAASVDDLESKVSSAINQLVRDQVAKSMGGPGGYYANYSSGVHKVAAKYQEYSKMPTPDQLDALARAKADEAWDDFVADLAKRGWTPAKVPYLAQDRVGRAVRAKVDVPRDWNTWEDGVFKQAVMRKVRSTTPTSAKFNGQTIPAGLSWQSFFAHPAIQGELRSQMRAPAGLVVRPKYDSAGQFQQEVFEPVVARLATQEIQRFKAPLETYEPKGSNYERGVTAARAVLLPPIALGFSMLGAIGHAAKLVYLLLRLVEAAMGPRGTRLARYALGAPIAVIGAAWLSLSLMSNPVSESRLYTFLQKQVVTGQPWIVSNALHVVAVGQSFMYPINEGIREKVLFGFAFGYKNATR